MSNFKKPNGQFDLSYVYQSRNRLNDMENQKHAIIKNNMRKKWVTAAIIALASGSTVLLSANTTHAATNNPNASTVNIEVVNQNNKQTENQSSSTQKNLAPQTDAKNQNVQEKQAEQKQKLSQNNTQVVMDQTQTKVATTQTDLNKQTIENNQASNHTQVNQAPANQQTSQQKNADPNQNVYEPANNDTHVKGDVISAWKQGFLGQGTVVAVIDSGADPTHKDFQTMPSDPKLTADEIKNKIKAQGYGRYVNEKFPYVYNYADHDNDYITSDDSNPNDSPHGQHVSGIIAADGQPDAKKDEYVVGVAPQAQLMMMRVFGQFADEKPDDIAKAIYDATNLGADVIQMSLGIGVADPQFTNIEQRAVEYAVEHGVFVSISASNDGNSASVDDPTNVPDQDNYTSGGNAGNYEPLNSSTVANPGASRNALTVAAETSGTGNDSDMASFSSWGPLSDYTLKPDLSAPGVDVISTVNHNQYETMSGTSMAGPFAAGSAALVIQRLKKTNPELKGAALVEATKAILMNSAKPQTQQGYTTPVSPRRQGAGQIDVGAATAEPVYVTADDGTGSLSLRQVNNKTPFTLTFHNLTDQPQTYTFTDNGGGYTEQRDSQTGVFHDVQLAGAQVDGATTFTLAPKETKQVKYSLDLTGLTKNQIVEGFLKFTNTKDNSTVSVPYLSYYGDLTNENVFDQDANDSHHDIEGNRFVDEDNYPRGIADDDSLKELVNIDGNYNWQEIAKLYESGKVAFSPNNDNKGDLIKPYTYLKQNVKDLKIEILDDKGNVVRIVSDVQGVDKSYDEDGVTKDTSLSASMRDNPDAFEWDGKAYNSKTGKMETVKDGKYTYRMIATLWNAGPNQKQTADFPIIVDTTAPTISNLNYDPTTHALTGTYSDQGAGFTKYSYATVTVNDKVLGFKLDDQNSGFDNTDETKGHFSFTLGADAQAALTGAENKISVALSDVADNTTVKTVDVAATTTSPAVSVWNATDGTAFSKTSKDYNTANNTYDLVGGATQDFYLNGKLVQVHNGQYEVPVAADSTQLIFSTDQAGKNVLKELDTTTPKAYFAWQETDTFQGSFGVPIYSLTTNNPNDTVVQAAVTKGKNVKAFAQDYFTGTIYKGTVKDGIATFHIHTSINKDQNGVNRRALLLGWTEVDGPSYNDRQETAHARYPYPRTVYLGVYYLPKQKTRNVYTNQDQLGDTVIDGVADPADFGPGAYPGHAPSDLTTRTDPNPDIHFDYMNDNDTTRFGENAVLKGYYNPVTKKFTVTGKVDSSVTSLTVLGDNPNEEAPENQVKLNPDGTFTFSVTANPTGQRPIAYIYHTKDGQLTRGTLNLILDTVAPTLKVNQVNSNDLELWTNLPQFTLSGTVDDNLDGYRLYVDGNNIYREFENSGHNAIVGLNVKDANSEQINPYTAHNFSEVLNLNDNKNQPTTHIFTVEVVDQVGNIVEKKVTVHFVPAVSPVEPVTPVNPATPSEPNQATQGGTVLPHEETSQVRVWEYKGAFIYNADHERIQDTKMYLPGSGHNVVADEYGQPRVYHLTDFEAFKLSDGSHQGDYVDIRNFRNYGIVKTLRVTSRIYNVNGEVTSPSRYIRKGTRIKIYGQFRINGRIYYRIGHNQFILARNFKHNLAGYLTKIVKRRSRSYKASDRVARPVRYIKKGTKIRVFGKTKIHGKVFYRMSSGELILAKNVK